MDQVDVLVVGAGVVGLAAARALAMRGRDVIVAEAAPRYGSGVSSRSSEVVHAGLYYEPGSLKARLCVRGRELLYAYCRERGVAHARCGKLVVATRQQDEGRLEARTWGTPDGREALDAIVREASKDITAAPEAIADGARLTGERRQRFLERPSTFKKYAAWRKLLELRESGRMPADEREILG